jgi:protocatechuate 3,4-dioxygenase, beta subunit
MKPTILDRRSFLTRASGLALSFFAVPGAFAEELVRTPRQTEGPFYPDQLPLDTDNDLIVINDATTPAVGEITWLSGRVLGPTGEPIRGALVEIWQCDSTGVYRHAGTGGDKAKRDVHFQSFGRFLTGTSGEYLFRTIKPVPYPGRAPHIHFKIKHRAQELLTTQCYIKDHPGNERDGIWRNLRDERQRENVTVDFSPVAGSRIGELAARFEIVLGTTPETA